VSMTVSPVRVASPTPPSPSPPPRATSGEPRQGASTVAGSP
jgi:hypothetical protein